MIFKRFQAKISTDSSPVISASQNPGIAFEWDADESEHIEKYRIGVFHHSNGQTLNESHVEFESNGANKTLAMPLRRPPSLRELPIAGVRQRL